MLSHLWSSKQPSFYITHSFKKNIFSVFFIHFQEAVNVFLVGRAKTAVQVCLQKKFYKAIEFKYQNAVYFGINFSFFFISACSSGSFGANCSQKCLCLNGGMCDPKDGHCSCKAGWTGSFCQQGTAFLHL